MIWINIALICFNVCIAVCNFIVSYHILKEGKKSKVQFVEYRGKVK